MLIPGCDFLRVSIRGLHRYQTNRSFSAQRPKVNIYCDSYNTNSGPWFPDTTPVPPSKVSGYRRGCLRLGSGSGRGSWLLGAPVPVGDPCRKEWNSEGGSRGTTDVETR